MLTVPAGTVDLKLGGSCTGSGSTTWSLAPSKISSEIYCADSTDGYELITEDIGYPRSDQPSEETVTVTATHGESWTLTFTFLTTRPSGA